jgi:hypothetical protein
VLTETDFLNRLSFDSPLDIKLHADALGRTVLFIGYSMTDPNIRLLLHSKLGKDQVIRTIARPFLCSCRRLTLRKRPCSPTGELRL